MKIGKFHFIIKREKHYVNVAQTFTSKTALAKWIMKNIEPKKTSKITIDAESGEAIVEEFVI